MPGHVRVGWLLLLALLCAACTDSATSVGPPVARPTSTASPASQVTVRAATIEYYQGGPGDPVVEVRVILENHHTRHTESTSILWDPTFAQSFVFLGSDPAPWRARLAEDGWGSLDTTGVIPGQFATYKLWFAAGTYAPLEPRLKIIANGGTLVAEVVASASHLKWQVPPAQQRAFESGPLAAISALAGFLPVGTRPAFVYALALGVTLLAVTLAGGLKAYRVTAH